jgi:prepilin-type N-terminal cleavage/methylation domain-containing protein
VASGKRSRQGGFSYIEVLVGIVILAIVALGVTQGFAGSSALIARSKAETLANNVAANQLERVRAMDYDDVGIVGGSPPGTIPATRTETVGTIAFRVDSAVDFVDDAALGQPRTYSNYKRVTVTVTPQIANARPYTDTTLVAPPSSGSIKGKATIIATLLDAITDTPLSGVPITADQSTSPTQTRSTDGDGKVVFAGLEPSAVSSTDPAYKYRLTIGLPDPWVADDGSGPNDAQQHLAASQTWNPVLEVYKRATVQVNLRDAATGQLIGERSTAQVTTPSPNPLSESQTGSAGAYTFTTIAGKPIKPSASNFTVSAQADCYADAQITRPVPVGYPTTTTEVFDFGMTRVASGYLDVTVRSTASGTPVIPGAEVSVSGNGLSAPRVRNTDQNGYVRFCLSPSGTASYVLSVTAPGYVSSSVLANVRLDTTTPATVMLSPSSSTGTITLKTSGSGALVRLAKVGGGYDKQQTTNSGTTADFTGLAACPSYTPTCSAGAYTAYIQTGYSGGNPTWNAGKTVYAVAGQTKLYTVP